VTSKTIKRGDNVFFKDKIVKINKPSTKVIPIKEILEQRGERYGYFTNHAHISQNMKFIMRKSKQWTNLSDDKKEALDMIVHKIARILNGDPEYKDSWTDIRGYTKLVEDTLQ
jgi:hypothetical protein